MRRLAAIPIPLAVTAVLVVALVALGDLVVRDQWSGAASATLAVAAALAVTIARPQALRSRRGVVALAAAGGCALLPLERPSPLGWLFLWTLLAAASLAPR